VSRTASSILLATGLLAIVASMAVASGAAAALTRAGDPAKWRTFWTPMMKVLTHDRCFNCHTETNVRTGASHGGGDLDTQAQFACIGCHTANTTVVEGTCELFGNTGEGTLSLPDGTRRESASCMPGEGPGKIRVPTGPVWNRLGPPFTKDAREMCQMVKMNKSPEELVEHVETDALIDFAFIGNKAMDDQSPFSPVDIEPPPLTKPEFVNLLTRWITEAAMACGTDGEVTLDDNVKLDSRSAFGESKTRNETTAQIQIVDDVANSELHYGEASTASIETTLPGCPAKEGVEVHFTADGSPDTSYEINILPNNTYRMRFTLGAIEGQTVWSYKEQLCRPGTRGREKLPAESTIPLRFGVEDQVVQENSEHELILKGSTTVPDNMSVGPVVSSGDRKLTWDLLIK
jgi:hypothetical protein